MDRTHASETPELWNRLRAVRERLRAEHCEPCPVRNLAVCRELSLEELLELATMVREVSYRKRQQIFFEGRTASHVFILTNGAVKTSLSLPDGRRQITGFYYRSDFLGLVSRESYTCSAETITDTTLCSFKRKEYEGLLASHPHLEQALLKTESDEIDAFQHQMLLLGRETAQERVASFLLAQAPRSRDLGHAHRVWLPMTREDISDYLGLTTETVSRLFAHLIREGIIETLPDAMVGLVRVEELERMAGWCPWVGGDSGGRVSS